MSKYYLKKASRQDVGRTTVINTKAVASFFKVSVPNRDDTATIALRYLPDNTIDEAVKIIKKQDARIFIDQERFSEGDILLFESKVNGEFTLSIKTSSDPDYNNLNSKLRHNYLLANDLSKQTLLEDGDGSEKEYKAEIMKHPLNQILYGPPGTGKTYATVEKSLEILGLRTNDITENREIFKSLLNKNIFFVTMHPSYSYEDFVQGIKPIVSKKGSLLFETKPGIFKLISNLATKVYEDDGEILCTEIDNKDILRICFFLSKFNSKADKKANKHFGNESNGEVFAIIGKKYEISPNSIKNHRDKFDFLTTDERKGWVPRNGSNDTLDNTPLWPYHDVYLELKEKTFDEVVEIIKLIEKKSNTTIKRTEKNLNYVLILDEINRANISKVFGELITLLEEDKRIGNENELSITLPSGETFSVPPNLYIIGTMNTADKSIALVDVALRRRFQFIPMYPDSNVITNYCKNIDKEERNRKFEFMNAINSKLRIEKGVDFQIGHAYFLKENTLNNVINENIIPLLVEYMRNDLEKVKKLLFELGKPIDEEHYGKTGLLKI